MKPITFGRPYSGTWYLRAGRQPIQMWRKRQRVRWYTAKGVQIGPEQANVAPALAWAHVNGYIGEDWLARGFVAPRYERNASGVFVEARP